MLRRILGVALVAAFPALPAAAEEAVARPSRPTDPMLTPVPPPERTVGSWEEALTLVRSNSADLHIQVNEVKRSEAATRTALAAALFSLNATGSVTHNFITNQSVSGLDARTGLPIGGANVPAQDSASASIALAQPIFAMAAWHQIGTAKRGEEVARLAMADVKRTISLGVANSLVGVVTAERVAELNRIGLESALERLTLARRRAELGGGNQLDVVRAQQDVESARATLVTGDESLRQAREALGLALGVAAPIGVRRDLNLDGLEKDARRVCQPEPSVETRPDVAAQRKRIEVAERNVDNVRLQFLPTVSAQSNVNTNTPVLGVAPGTTWNIQGVVSWNVWDGGARYGRTRDAEATARNAEETLGALRRTATIQVTQARRAVEVAERARDVAAAARQLSADVDRLTRLSFQEGRGTSLELVVAAAALRQAEVTLALREFELVRARFPWTLALASCPW